MTHHYPKASRAARATFCALAFSFALAATTAPLPAHAQIGDELAALGDDIQHAATKGKNAVVNSGESVGDAASPVTDKVGDALQPVGDAVAPVTDPIGDSASTVYHKASGYIGESHAPDGGEAALKKGIHCATAKQDIKTLQDAKAGTGRQVMAGVSSVFPVSAVVGLLKGNYSENVRVSAGQYNEDIDRKIVEIQKTCGVS